MVRAKKIAEISSPSPTRRQQAMEEVPFKRIVGCNVRGKHGHEQP
jgi:hypothetical protein